MISDSRKIICAARAGMNIIYPPMRISIPAFLCSVFLNIMVSAAMNTMPNIRRAVVPARISAVRPTIKIIIIISYFKKLAVTITIPTANTGISVKYPNIFSERPSFLRPVLYTMVPMIIGAMLITSTAMISPIVTASSPINVIGYDSGSEGISFVMYFCMDTASVIEMPSPH